MYASPGWFVWLIIFTLGFRAEAFAAWDPIPPEELQSTQSPVDPAAAVEILLKDVRISSGSFQTVRIGFMRLKVYNQKGIEELGKIDLETDYGERITSLVGRMIKPDGTEVALDPKSVVTRDGVKVGAARSRVKSFSFPQMEPGAIIEYRWVETDPSWYSGLQLLFQSRWPARVVRYHVRLYAFGPGELRTIWHRSRPQNGKADRDGFVHYEETNVPAIRFEPFAPPAPMTQSWVIAYLLDQREKGDKFWHRLGIRLNDRMREQVQAGGEVEQRARALTAGVGDELERLRRLYEFCVTEIQNTSINPEGETIEERVKRRTPKELLERKRGSAADINRLFLSLARALKFDARFAAVSDRGSRFFDRSLTAWMALPDETVAVRRGDDWAFFDPGSGYVPFGALRWRNELGTAVVADPKVELMVKTPGTPGEQSREVRTAELVLDAEGTLTGRVAYAYTGHSAVELKLAMADESDDARRQRYREALQARLGDVELSDFAVENLPGLASPLRVSFTVRVAGYAEPAGRRLFVQPAFFQKGRKTEFTEETREADIYFHYPWQEEDVVQMAVPADMTLEQGAAPRSLDGGPTYHYEVELGWLPAKKVLRYKRRFSFSAVLMKREAYPLLKREFDAIHVQDGHVLTLRVPAPVAPAEAVAQP